MTDIPARVAEEISQGGKDGLSSGSFKGVARVVAVLVADVADQAKIEIVTGLACDKFLLGENLNTGVAGTGGLLVVRDGLLLVGEGSRNFVALLVLDLWCNALGGAVDNASVLHEALDHPVALSGAMDTRVDASRTEIVVTTVTNAAVEVLVFHGVVAVVAVDDP